MVEVQGQSDIDLMSIYLALQRDKGRYYIGNKIFNQNGASKMSKQSLLDVVRSMIQQMISGLRWKMA